MVYHLVLFKLKSEVSETQRDELIERLNGMKGKIEGIVDLKAGVNVTPEVDRMKGYSVGLLVIFETMAHLEAYGPHPVHEEVKSFIRTIVDDVVVMDFEA